MTVRTPLITATIAISTAVLAVAAPPRLVIADVTVVDTTGGPLQPHRDVILDGDRIAAVQSAAATQDSGDTIIDGRGKFLIPGLWDMHAHTFQNDALLPDVILQLQLANGVTGVRDMGASTLEMPVLFRRAGDAGALRVPHLVVAGRVIDGTPPNKPRFVSVTTAEEARRAVDVEADGGVDFIKVYTELSRDAYFAIAAEAKKRGLPFGGHVPLAITMREAAEAGQATVEHFWGVLLGCSSREDALTAEERAENVKPPRGQFRGHLTTAQAAIDTFDARKAQALFETFVQRHTHHVPTLEALRRFGAPRAEPPGLEYMPTIVRQTAMVGAGRMNPTLVADARVYYAEVLKLVLQMHRAGVPFMAGTDGVTPGFMLHQDLERFVDAGFTPLEALQTATIVPARFLHREDRFGAIASGRAADLVLLDEDPTRAIANTKKIRAVIFKGELLDRAALDAMLARIKAATNPS